MVRSWKFRYHIKARDKTKRISDFGGKFRSLIPSEGNMFPIFPAGDSREKPRELIPGVNTRENCRVNTYVMQFSSHCNNMILQGTLSVSLSLLSPLFLSLSPIINISLTKHHIALEVREIRREKPREIRSQQTGKLSVVIFCRILYSVSLSLSLSQQIILSLYSYY